MRQLRPRRKPGRKAFSTERVWETIQTQARSAGDTQYRVTLAQIASDCGHHGGAVSVRTVSTALRELVRRGWIEVTQTKHAVWIEVVR
jgi:CRP-like cAMP-binding protein